MEPLNLITNCFNEYKARHPTAPRTTLHFFDRPHGTISLDSTCIMSEDTTKISAQNVLTMLGATFVGGAKVDLSASLIALRGKENETIIIVATKLLKISSKQLFLENVNIIVTQDTVLEIDVKEGISAIHGVKMLQSAQLRDRVTPIEKYALTTPRMAELILQPFDFSTTNSKDFASTVEKKFVATTSLVMISCESVFFSIRADGQAALMRTSQHFLFPQNVKSLPKDDRELYEKIKKLYLSILAMPIENKKLNDMLLTRICTLNLPFYTPEVQNLLREIRAESNQEKNTDDRHLILEKRRSLYRDVVGEVAKIFKEMIVYYVGPNGLDIVRKGRFFKTLVKTCGNCKRYETTTTQLKVCGACSGIFYCSTHCQKIHWKQHRIVCALRTDSTPK